MVLCKNPAQGPASSPLSSLLLAPYPWTLKDYGKRLPSNTRLRTTRVSLYAEDWKGGALGTDPKEETWGVKGSLLSDC